MRVTREAMVLTTVAAGSLLGAAAAMGQVAHPVGDVNSTPRGSAPSMFRSLSGRVVFHAASPAGAGAWVTDGTAEGTHELSPASILERLGNIVLLKSGTELLRSDGTVAGTFAIGPAPDGPGPIASNRMYFVVGNDVWRTDGTAPGTALLRAFETAATSMVAVDPPWVYVFRQNAIWRFDENDPEASLQRATPIGSGPYLEVLAYGGRLYYTRDDPATGVELWRSDGTAASAAIVRDIEPGAAGSDPRGLTGVGGLVYFIPNDKRIWRTDGTEVGTVATDLPLESPWRWMSASGGGLLIAAIDSLGAQPFVYGGELWFSNGAAAGTHVLGDVAPMFRTGLDGPDVSPSIPPSWFDRDGERIFYGGNPLGCCNHPESKAIFTWAPGDPGVRQVTPYTELFRGAGLIGSGFVFAHRDEAGDEELWVSDGPPESARPLVNIDPGTLGLDHLPTPMVFQGRVVMLGHQELLVVDGPDLQRIPLPMLASTGIPSGAERATVAGGRLYFSGTGDGGQSDLWVLDALDAAPRRVDVPMGQSPPKRPFAFVALGNAAYFTADWQPPDPIRVVWRSDGTSAGTIPLIAPGTTGAATNLRVGAGRVVYEMDYGDGNLGWLVATDGTPAGTQVLAELNEQQVEVAFANQQVFFVLRGRVDGPQHDELYVSDGTAAGTRRLPTGVEALEAPRTRLLTPVRRFGPDLLAGVVFSNAPTPGDSGLWFSDGTDAGTRPIENIRPGPAGALVEEITVAENAAGERVFFTAVDDAHGRELWAADGAVEGARLVKDITPGPDSTNFRDLVGLRGHPGTAQRRLLFDLIDQNQLWVRPGTDAGTAPVPGVASGGLDDAVTLHGRIIFAADDGVHGLEPWITDGTIEGTRMLVDARPGEAAGLPAALRPRFKVAGSRVVFLADNGITGLEPWIVDLCPGDFDNSGAIGVEDIFEFLRAYFGQEGRADVGRDGVVGVQDLFDWLAAYFAGCG